MRWQGRAEPGMTFILSHLLSKGFNLLFTAVSLLFKEFNLSYRLYVFCTLRMMSRCVSPVTHAQL